MDEQLSDETLARLRVLVWIAQADGEIQPWEKNILAQILQTLTLTEKDSNVIADETEGLLILERIVKETFSLEQALSILQSPEVQLATYNDALTIAQLDGITSTEESRLDYLRRVFHLPNCALESIPPSTKDAEVDWSGSTVSGRGIVLGMRRLINHSRVMD